MPHDPSYRAYPQLYTCPEDSRPEHMRWLVRSWAVRPEGANYQWRKITPEELSIDPAADDAS